MASNLNRIFLCTPLRQQFSGKLHPQTHSSRPVSATQDGAAAGAPALGALCDLDGDLGSGGAEADTGRPVRRQADLQRVSPGSHLRLVRSTREYLGLVTRSTVSFLSIATFL